MNKVYIVIVNYNNFRDTIECLESLLKSSYSNFQVFVIDNSSDDTSINQFKNWIGGDSHIDIQTQFKYLVFPTVDKPIDHIIVSEEDFSIGSEGLPETKITIITAKNRGFAAANNIAIKHIVKNGLDSSLVWILNNDTVVEKDTLKNHVDFYLKDVNSNYIFGSKLRCYFKPDVIQAVAGHYNIWIGKHRHIGDGEYDRGQYDNYKYGKLNYIVGASIFLPKLFLDLVGPMSEEYFLYFEELDWLKRGSRAGFTPVLVPNAIVYHKEGASIIGKQIKPDTSIAEYYSMTNRVRFIKKWYPYSLFTVLAGVIFALFKRLIKGKFVLVKNTSISICKILFTNNF